VRCAAFLLGSLGEAIGARARAGPVLHADDTPVQALDRGRGQAAAAESALNRVRARLANMGRRDPSMEMKLSMADQWNSTNFENQKINCEVKTCLTDPIRP
jgi:fatty acid-binding protein DegV